MQVTDLSAGYSFLCQVPAMLLPDDSRSGVLLRIASELLCAFNTVFYFCFKGQSAEQLPQPDPPSYWGFPQSSFFVAGPKRRYSFHKAAPAAMPMMIYVNIS